MPSTTSSSVSAVLASSTVITPSLPTFCMAWAIISPISLSPLAEIVPTWATSSEVDPALQVHRIDAGGDVLGALADDGLGQHGRGGGAVTRDVVGLRGHFAHHLGAHVLEAVGELDLLGDRHTVLGDARGAEALLDHDVAALRAQRHLHRVGEDVDAAQHLIAGVGGETNVFRCHLCHSS